MTKSNKSQVNLKSTAYNQTGQNYYQQLTTYDSMSAHLRHTLLATCVVDTRNKDYVRKSRQLDKPCNCKSPFLRADITDTVIYRLTHNTMCRSADCLRMCYGSRYLYRRDASKDIGNSCKYVVSSSLPTLQPNDPEPCSSNNGDIEPRSFTTGKKIFMPVRTKGSFKKIPDRGEENSTFYESTPDLRSREINNPSLVLGTSSSSGQEIQMKNEEVKYANFLYEITREIIADCFYTDEELQQVFEKHIEANRKILDMNRMLYEIYQLKQAINVSDNLEGQELDLVRTRQTAKASGITSSSSASVSSENAN